MPVMAILSSVSVLAGQCECPVGTGSPGLAREVAPSTGPARASCGPAPLLLGWHGDCPVHYTAKLTAAWGPCQVPRHSAPFLRSLLKVTPASAPPLTLSPTRPQVSDRWAWGLPRGRASGRRLPGGAPNGRCACCPPAGPRFVPSLNISTVPSSPFPRRTLHSIEMRLQKASAGRCCLDLSPGTNSKLCCFPF